MSATRVDPSHPRRTHRVRGATPLVACMILGLLSLAFADVDRQLAQVRAAGSRLPFYNKNHYLVHDDQGSHKWLVVPWDLDRRRWPGVQTDLHTGMARVKRYLEQRRTYLQREVANLRRSAVAPSEPQR